MEIKINRSKCVKGCTLCFEACPKLTKKAIETHSKEELLEFLKSSHLSKETKDKCPENAFEETLTGACKLNEEKCKECGTCIESSNGKIISDAGKPVKCDLCYGEEDYKCVKSCPYDALKIVYTEEEKRELNNKIGYRIREKGSYELDEENFSLSEARLIKKVLEEIREKNTGTDREEIEAEVEGKCLEMNLELTEDHVNKLTSHLYREINGLSILEPLLNDPEIEEISIIAPGKPLYIYHMERGWETTNLVITSSEKVKNLINKASRKLNRRITLKKPRINANIEKGRIHGAIKPLSTTGNCMTIRKFTKNAFKPRELVENNTVDKGLMELIEKAVKCDTNLLIAGNTGSGKTTTLNSLLHFLPKEERIIIVEETPEINPPQNHVIRLTTSPSLDIEMHELVADTLRMRPDRVIVGEVRTSKEVKALFDTMLAGQGKGSMATFHGNSIRETITRLKSLGVKENDLESIDLILIQRRWIDLSNNGKEVREVIQAATVERRTGKPINLYSRESGFKPTELRGTSLMKKLELSYGKEQDKIIKELKHKRKKRGAVHEPK